jgi:hypothetical protein
VAVAAYPGADGESARANGRKTYTSD